MNPVQYILINKAAGMSAGKMAAQAAHASVEGVRLSARTPNGNPWDASIVNRWYRGGHYAKIVLEVENAQALLVAKEYITSRGFKCSLIIDEGRTEIQPMTPTALGCEVVDKDQPHARETFSAFRLYQEPVIDTAFNYLWDNGLDTNPEPRSEDGNAARQPDGST